MTARLPKAPRPPLTVAQAADELGVDARTVYYWIQSGALACVRYPGTRPERQGAIRIEPADVEAFRTRHRQETAS